MKIRWTLDNAFRNPFRWGRMHQKHLDHPRVYGVTFDTFWVPAEIGKKWQLTFYFHKWYRAFSNYPFNP